MTSSMGSSSTHLPPPFVSTNSHEKNMSLDFPERDANDLHETEDEALVMKFQWHDHAAADRFKHPLQKSHGPNGECVRNDSWEEHVACPLRHFQGHGAKHDIHKLELRGVEPRNQSRLWASSKVGGRESSGSKRLSMMALGLGGKVSGIWG